MLLNSLNKFWCRQSPIPNLIEIRSVALDMTYEYTFSIEVKEGHNFSIENTNVVIFHLFKSFNV
jgi:hypothetical protein